MRVHEIRPQNEATAKSARSQKTGKRDPDGCSVSGATPVVRGVRQETHINIMQFAYVFKRGHHVKNMTLSELEQRELTQQVCSRCESLK